MFGKVLLPTDFSEDSTRVLEYVKDLPRIREVFLLHVIDASRPSLHGWEHGRKIENAKILMEESRGLLEKSGIHTDVVIETVVNTITQGDIPFRILEQAGVSGSSLIVMGARGKNTIQNIVIGSISAEVIRRTAVPVLLMRFPRGSRAGEPRRHLFSRILVPVDFSEPSQNALTLLEDLPSFSQVILFHVVDKGESEEEIQEAIRIAKENLAAIVHDLAARSITAEALVHAGDPSEEITATAVRCGATLIVMSPRGEGWTRDIRTLFIGSTTNAVVRHARVPVLVAAGRPPG